VCGFAYLDSEAEVRKSEAVYNHLGRENVQLREKLRVAVEALERYASGANWSSLAADRTQDLWIDDLSRDGFEVASDALARIKGGDDE
jgi:hypothetical protein